MNPDSMTQVLSLARKITCAGVRRMRVFCVVFTLGEEFLRLGRFAAASEAAA